MPSKIITCRYCSSGLKRNKQTVIQNEPEGWLTLSKTETVFNFSN